MKKTSLLLMALLAVACAPSRQYTNQEVPTLPKLDDIMWAQAQATDPQWKKIGASSYTDEDYAAFGAVSERLQLTTSCMKKDFSKGPEFDQLTDTLNQHAATLAQAAASKDAAGASKALADIKDTCKACHSKFR